MIKQIELLRKIAGSSFGTPYQGVAAQREVQDAIQAALASKAKAEQMFQKCRAKDF